MYRTLIVALLSSIAVSAAPKDTINSDITYVKINPVTEDNTPPKSPYRESRIENLPLTIHGNPRSIDKNTKRDKEIPNDDRTDSKRRIRNETAEKESRHDDKVPIFKHSHDKKEDNPRQIRSENTKRDNYDVQVNNDASQIPGEVDSFNNPRRIRSEDTTGSYEADAAESTEVTTETVEDLTQQTAEHEARTKAPRFISKLSYFRKDNGIKSFIATNLVDATGKRRFISKCRCEKIWNCPKLQITVPRCPNEYFLCC